METCSVCGARIEGEPRRIGNRVFCERHYARATGSRLRVYAGTAAGIAANCLLAVVIGALLGRHVIGGTVAGRALGVLLAAAPSLVWLVVFYRLDAVEPEPVPMVLGAFALGVLVEGAVAIPLCERLVPAAAYALAGRPALDLLQSMLFAGAVRVLLFYAALRVSFYPNPEFDEKVDGIVYGAAIGLGAGAAANAQAVLGSDGIWLWTAGFDFAVNCLAGACTGALVGFALAKAKFEGLGGPGLLGLLAAATALEGLTRHISRAQFSLGLSYAPWLKLVTVAAIGLAVFAALFIVSLAEGRKTLASAGKGGAT